MEQKKLKGNLIIKGAREQRPGKNAGAAITGRKPGQPRRLSNGKKVVMPARSSGKKEGKQGKTKPNVRSHALAEKNITSFNERLRSSPNYKGYYVMDMKEIVSKGYDQKKIDDEKAKNTSIKFIVTFLSSCDDWNSGIIQKEHVSKILRTHFGWEEANLKGLPKQDPIKALSDKEAIRQAKVLKTSLLAVITNPHAKFDEQPSKAFAGATYSNARKIAVIAYRNSISATDAINRVKQALPSVKFDEKVVRAKHQKMVTKKNSKRKNKSNSNPNAKPRTLKVAEKAEEAVEVKITSEPAKNGKPVVTVAVTEAEWSEPPNDRGGASQGNRKERRNRRNGKNSNESTSSKGTAEPVELDVKEEGGKTYIKNSKNEWVPLVLKKNK